MREQHLTLPRATPLMVDQAQPADGKLLALTVYLSGIA